MTIQDWQDFLRIWSDEWLATEEKFPSKARKNRWLGFQPATPKQLTDLETRLGYRLPPSYRNFLLATNGWSRTSMFVRGLRPTRRVEWLEVDDPELLDVWSEGDMPDPTANDSPQEYFLYDGWPFFDFEHLRKSLVIADPVAGDSMIYVLNPLAVAQDGEWEAWRFAHWIPGAERFPSFELLMRSEHELFRHAAGATITTICGPFAGPYAPDQPRHAAEKLGRGRRKPPRLTLTIPQLVAQLEAPDRKMRMEAAKRLHRACGLRTYADDHPEILQPLTRILKGESEAEVRCAAAMMLGIYGDAAAISPLLDALDDAQVLASAIGALFEIAIDIKDRQIADAMVRLLESPRDYFVTGKAMDILKELEDSRSAMLGLRLLDGDLKLEFGFPKSKGGEIPPDAERLQTSWLRFAGAFAFATFAENPTGELVARLSNANGDIRAAALAALRDDKIRGPHLSKHVHPLLDDPDPAVRQQATMTLGFLNHRPSVAISPQHAEGVEQQIAQILRIASKRKSRS